MKLKTIIILITITVGVLAGMTALLWNYSSSTEKPILDIAGDKRHVMGSGKVVVTEWSDFQCPACSGVEADLKNLISKYQDKITFVYRHYPLTSIHKHALEAAILAEAAGEQGKFWEVHNILFAKQSEWENMDSVSEVFLDYAASVGVDMDKLKKDLENEEVKSRVTTDMRQAVGYKIQGTPTFFVNGERVSFPELESLIKAKISE